MCVTVRACICVCASVGDVLESQPNSMQHKHLGILYNQGRSKRVDRVDNVLGSRGSKGPQNKINPKNTIVLGDISLFLVHGPPKVLLRLYIILYSSSGSKIVFGFFEVQISINIYD